MKLLITGIFLFAVSCVAYAESTCLSRCEERFGVGDKDCPEMCQGVDERIKRKKKNDGAASAFAAGFASASTPKNDAVDPKAVKPAPDNVQPGKEK